MVEMEYGDCFREHRDKGDIINITRRWPDPSTPSRLVLSIELLKMSLNVANMVNIVADHSNFKKLNKDECVVQILYLCFPIQRHLFNVYIAH